MEYPKQIEAKKLEVLQGHLTDDQKRALRVRENDIAAGRDPSEIKATSKFTPEIVKVIYEGIIDGLPQHYALQAAGINKRTFHYWKAKGELEWDGDQESEPEGPFGEFLKQCCRLRAEWVRAKLQHMDMVAKGGQVIEEEEFTRKDGSVVVRRKYTPPNWLPDAWQLERGEKETFALTTKVEHSGGTKSEIRIIEPDNWRGNPSNLPTANAEEVIEGVLTDSAPVNTL